ncbi:hypothetical protein H0H92_008442 [Tricholoma furcatifolium]|nr:hypothetical protein H0H92_008442 [Tricholoma furcatifolium]
MATRLHHPSTSSHMGHKLLDSNPLETYCSTSFVGDLSYQAPASQIAGMEHTLVTGRKTWKTSKGKNEAVWPAYIEAALFDGEPDLALEKYRPASSGDPKLLRRFPKRNRFISDHIRKVTGKERTPKQVGSRLQQLRDTCQEEKVLKLLSRREFPPDIKTTFTPDRSRSPSSGPGLSPSSTSTSTSPTSSPFVTEFTDAYNRGLDLSSPISHFADRQASDGNPPIVVVDFISRPRKVPHPVLPPHRPDPVYLLEFELPSNGPYPYIRPEHRSIRLTHSGCLSSLAPSVKVLSPTPLPAGARSLFCVFLDDTLQCNEAAELELLPGLSVNGSAQYCARLVPQYWATLCQQPDLSRYTITQDIMLASIDAGQTMQEAVLSTVSYKLRPSAVKLEYPMDYQVPNAQHVGSLYAPRPLLLDTANTLLSTPAAAQQPDNVWYDHCGPTMHQPPPQAPSYDFLSVDEAEALKPLDDLSYLSYNWCKILVAQTDVTSPAYGHYILTISKYYYYNHVQLYGFKKAVFPRTLALSGFSGKELIFEGNLSDSVMEIVYHEYGQIRARGVGISETLFKL